MQQGAAGEVWDLLPLEEKAKHKREFQSPDATHTRELKPRRDERKSQGVCVSTMKHDTAACARGGDLGLLCAENRAP